MKKLVVITGASSGIGEAIARKFSADGYPTLLLARRIDQMQQFDLPNSLCSQVDVTDINSFKAAIAAAEKKFGPVDCLVNNAGVMLLGDPSSQNPLEWKTMIDVNITGLLNGIHVVLKDMISRQTGTIINIGSVAGRKSLSDHAVYCGTKFAVHAISEAVRMETAKHNVRSITIAPGATESELVSHVSSDAIKDGYKGWADSIGGPIKAEDVANAVHFAYIQPQNVCIREIVLAPTKQEP
jgi:NADP-dependent 3-hydroxy acid dehydrogenase YdfG